MRVINFSNYKMNENSDNDVFKNIKTHYTIDLSYDINELITELKKFCLEYNITPTSDLVDYFVDNLVDEILSESRDFNLYLFLERFEYNSFEDFFKDRIKDNDFEEYEQIKKIEKTKNFNL